MNNGAFGENFPYSNFHDLNLDWIIKIAKDFLDQYTNISEIITTGEDDLSEIVSNGITELTEKTTELETLLNEWYTTHSNDIATELETALTDFRTTASNYVNQIIESIPADYSELSDELNFLYDNIVTFTDNLNRVVNGNYTLDGSGNIIIGATYQYGMSDRIPITGGTTYYITTYGLTPTSSAMLTIQTIKSDSTKTRNSYANVDPRAFTTDPLATEMAVFISMKDGETPVPSTTKIQIARRTTAEYLPPMTAIDYFAREQILDSSNTRTPLSAGDNIDNLPIGRYLIGSDSIASQIYGLPHGASAGVIDIGNGHIEREKHVYYSTNKQMINTIFTKIVRSDGVGDWSQLLENELTPVIPSTTGIANIIRNAYNLIDIMYKTTNTLPLFNGDKPANSNIRGVPYSSAKYYDKFIGSDILIYTFLSAINNPSSIIYTERLNPNYNALTYYGTVCSAFACYCYGIPYVLYASDIYNDNPLFTEETGEYELGDIISTLTHSAIVTGIYKNKYGIITHYEVSEAVRPLTRSLIYTVNNFNELISSAKHKRYINRNSVEYSPYTIPPTEHLITNYGNKCTIPVNTTVILTKIDRPNAMVHLFKDGTKISEYASTDTTITLTSLTAGSYEAKLFENNAYDSITCEFIITSISATHTSTQVSFSNPDNGTPFAISYNTEYGDPMYTQPLTPEEIENGTAPIRYDGTYEWIKIYMRNEFGVTSFTA